MSRRLSHWWNVSDHAGNRGVLEGAELGSLQPAAFQMPEVKNNQATQGVCLGDYCAYYAPFTLVEISDYYSSKIVDIGFGRNEAAHAMLPSTARL